MKTLVIHPKDTTTDFLKPIYEGKGYTVLTKRLTKRAMERIITEHDRIIMLGHGAHFGLITSTSTDFDVVVGHEDVHLLRSKELIGIWCNADKFFEFHKLKGFYTGMFISEDVEAMLYLKDTYSPEHIEQSNNLFAELMGEHIDNPSILAKVKKEYIGVNPIIDYNKQRLYKTMYI